MIFDKLLIANRGEIACRVIETARKMGLRTVAVFSDVDQGARHVDLADEAVRIGGAAPAESYLRGEAIIAAARATGAGAIHPGYGFLSENPDFVEAVEAAGLVFVGPSASAIRAMGLKDAAKALMAEAGVPVVPGYHGADQEPGRLEVEAAEIGYPVLIKAVAGGGGKGMRKVARPEDFIDAMESAKAEARTAFGNDAVLIEKFVENGCADRSCRPRRKSKPKSRNLPKSSDWCCSSSRSVCNSGRESCNFGESKDCYSTDSPWPSLDSGSR